MRQAAGIGAPRARVASVPSRRQVLIPLVVVAIAGGFTYRARENRMTIIRANDPARERLQATQETMVLPGDVIEVPQRFF